MAPASEGTASDIDAEFGVSVVEDPHPATGCEHVIDRPPERLEPIVGDMGKPEAEGNDVATAARPPGEDVGLDILHPIREPQVR